MVSQPTTRRPARFLHTLETPGRYALPLGEGRAMPAVARFDARPADDRGDVRPWFSDFDEAE